MGVAVGTEEERVGAGERFMRAAVPVQRVVGTAQDWKREVSDEQREAVKVEVQKTYQELQHRTKG